MRNYEVTAIVTMVFPKVEAESAEEAIEKTANKIPTTIKNGEDIVCSCELSDAFAKTYDLMDSTNHHNKELVRKINEAWIRRRGLFITITDLLIERDTDMESNPELYTKDSEARCRAYCQNIADNKDLETILGYCRE